MNPGKHAKLKQEIIAFIDSRKSLMLSSTGLDGKPYASYAPFAYDDQAIYILISEIAIHANNLIKTPEASVLIIEDEDSAEELFARVRVNYSMDVKRCEYEDDSWYKGLHVLHARLGDRIESLSEMSDFHLFRLEPKGGRYVKGFAKAYSLGSGALTNIEINHLRDGHRKRASTEASQEA